MSDSMILLSVLLILGTFIPFFVLNSSGKGGLKSISNKIKEMAKTDGLKFSQQESWGNSTIALDPKNRILVFGKMIGETPHMEKVALEEVEKINILKKDKSVKSHTGQMDILEKLDLEIVFLNHHKGSLLLNFFDMNNVYSEDYELDRAKKWQAAVKEVLKTAPQERKVA